MKIYHLHHETGELLAEGVADESPLEPGVFLIPAHATETAPPAAVAGKSRHFGANGWEHRDIPAPPAPPVPPSAAQVRKGEILARLSGIDFESIRALRSKAVGKGHAADDTKLAALDAEADTLRAELAALVI